MVLKNEGEDMFRKTAHEYQQEPIGQVVDYGAGLYIDSQNNVYEFDGLHYIKIGYDNPSMDLLAKTIPNFSFYQHTVNLFSPKKRGNDSGDTWITILAVFVARLFLLFLDGLAWCWYKLWTFFGAKYLLQATKQVPILRLFLPNLWFVDEDEGTGYVAIHSSFFPLCLIIFLTALTFMEREEYGFAKLVLGVVTAVEAFLFLANAKINLGWKVHKYR